MEADPKLPSVVEFRSVTKTYAAGTKRAFTAVKDVTFRVDDIPGKGEFIGILGPSGCGKSTILRLIAGLLPQHPPTSGQVLVRNQVVTHPGADRGMVFQDYSSFPNRSVRDNIAFGLECQGVGKEERYSRARDWVGRVGLDPDKDLHKYPHELSGGMRQRVAIARTLILHPRIILMDEPFGALDPVTRQEMQDLLISLWRELEATVFFVTHDVSEAVYLGDRVFVFSNSPGTILTEETVPPPDRPSREMRREPAFQKRVFEISALLEDLEAENDIVACARDVHQTLGPGRSVSSYTAAFENALLAAGILVSNPKPFAVRKMDGPDLGDWVPDLEAGEVLVDAKATGAIGDDERRLMQTFLRLSGKRVGLVINFQNPELEWERIIR